MKNPVPENLREQYEEFIDSADKMEKPVGLIDQNLALIREAGAAVGIDLRDPEQLKIAEAANALISIYSMNHAVSSCEYPQGPCSAAAVHHMQLAFGTFGSLLREMKKLM